jgi:hypothetical protein
MAIHAGAQNHPMASHEHRFIISRRGVVFSSPDVDLLEDFVIRRGSTYAMSLSANLEKVISDLKGDDALQQMIATHTDVLDRTAQVAMDGSQADRAIAACKVSGIVFGDRAVMAGGDAYTQKQEKNWYVIRPAPSSTSLARAMPSCRETHGSEW